MMLDRSRVTQRSHERTLGAQTKTDGADNGKLLRAAPHGRPWTKSKDRMTPAVEFLSQSHREHGASQPKAERGEA